MTSQPSLNEGDRIKMVQMGNDPNPIEPGTLGTVTGYRYPRSGASTDGTVSHGVRWDNDRGLAIILPLDMVEVVTTI